MSSPRVLGGLALAAFCVVSAACSDSSGTDGSSRGATSGVAVKVLSNRADLVSGGDALVELVFPAGLSLSSVSIELDGEDVSSAFAVRPNGRTIGFVSGLAEGENELAVRGPRGGTSRVTIVDHPNGGPVFAGPQPQPWTCQDGAVDDQCNQAPVYSFLYQPTDSSKPLQRYDPAHPPSDVATTTTDEGVTVPFVVRMETGYQDRDQYKILVLFRPGEAWEPWAPQPQWNRKLLITHGGGCGVDYRTDEAPLDDYSGTIPANPVLSIVARQSYVVALGRGFAVMSTALDDNGHNCNLVTQAESLMMAKERLVEAYGEIRYTIGTGCSGGSLTQQWVANAYPGIYQGLLPTCSFPDAWTSASQVGDYHLLREYFENPSRWGPGIFWIPLQWSFVEGHVLFLNAIVSDEGFFAVVRPTNDCGGITAAERYHPQTNPAGVRCGIADFVINVLGPRQPSFWGPQEKLLERGFGGIPLDNVGVPYGLDALRQGLILPAQFVDLNEKIGGLDVDINRTAERRAADQPALANAYRTGGINVTNNLDQVAIIDGRGPDPGFAHDAYRALALRARLDREHDGHANQVIWGGPIPIIGDVHYTVDALRAMDRWLARVEQDASDRPLARKIVDARPADVGDRCSDGLGLKLLDGLCPDLIVPIYATPRMVAGEAITTDTNKCQLKPLRRGDDYGLIPFTAAEWATLERVFPDGVCDYTRPGVDQQPTIPWLSYQDDDGEVIYGGRPLPAAPSGSAAGWASPAFRVFGD